MTAAAEVLLCACACACACVAETINDGASTRMDNGVVVVGEGSEEPGA